MLRRLLLTLILLLFMVGLAAGSGPEQSDPITVGDRTAQVLQTAPGTLRISVEAVQWEYVRSGNTTTLSGPPQASPEETQFVYAVVDQWLRVHPRWAAAAPNGGVTRQFVGIFLALVGLMGAIRPDWAWYLAEGWKFQDAEPGGAALLFNRLGGAVLTVVGVVMVLA